MQSGYGGVSEIQQFMVDGAGAAHTLFSTRPHNPSAATVVTAQEIHHHHAAVQPYKFNPFHHHHHHHHHQTSPAPAPHFPHFHAMPITQQLFTQPPHPHHPHHFQLFHPALDHDPGPENSSTGASPSFLATAMSFKLAVNDSDGGGGGGEEGPNDDNVGVAGSILHGDEASQSRLRSSWHREDDCAIKEPFWRPLDLDFINHNSKRCKDTEPEHHFVKRIRDAGEPESSHTGGAAASASSNYKIFSELEAIYQPGSSLGGAIAAEEATNMNPHSRPNQTGSGSVLTGDEHNLMHPTPAAPALDPRVEDDNSTGGEAHTKTIPHAHSRRRRRRRHLQMATVAAFFEGLMKQLMDQQESLHRRFLDIMECRDRERVGREEAWREQEAARSRRETAARAHERALSAARESAIISFLEKITGETLHLPAAAAAACGADDQRVDDGDGDDSGTQNKLMIGTSRWPKAEVQALIGVRSGLEARFQEPGLKGPLWEEVSAAMDAMGYRRSAKRCKEKWENINKYFRKTKDSGRKRSQSMKTCPYFQQLDQLYSSSKSLAAPPSKNSELLDAVVVPTENRMLISGSNRSESLQGEEEVGESEGQGKDPLEEEDEDEDAAETTASAEIEAFRPPPD
ncbi:Trihelix transcription factor GT-2 [Apostasia shenzhenica]|uniref:Trihelix transcription factor GT-2 n=1 Tax=Apostasia shenzhenica TaxID=1088818 RepID=A0A2I0A3J5_9ASPA|nr:Trihelix transcription factor GT-2 [Apostasia shenzhenica]